MQFRHLLIVLAVVGLGASLVSNILPSEAAFGTSPPWVRNDHLLPGTTFEQIVNLSRNEVDSDMKVNVRITGDKELSDWIKIENEDRLVMKKGESFLPMNVIVEVPQNAALRDYKGGIFVTLEPVSGGETQGGTVAITLGANISVELSVVGVKIINYRIQSVSVSPLSKGEPFALTVDLENTGNTAIDAINGQVDIYDEHETQVLKTLTFGKLSEPVAPDEEGKSTLRFDDLTLDPGNYWVKVKIFKDKEVIYSNRLFQQVSEKTASEEGLSKKPALPRLPGETVAPEAPQSSSETLKPSAPVDKLILILGLAGFGFGLIATIGVIVVLWYVIKSQREANLERYLASQMKNQNP